MALDFQGAAGGRRVAEPTLAFEREHAVQLPYTQAVSAALEVAYTVPAGRTLYITKMIYCNTEGAASGVKILINAGIIWQQSAAANISLDKSFTSAPLVLTGGDQIKVQSNYNPKYYFSGWLL